MQTSTRPESRRDPAERLVRSQLASVADVGDDLCVVGRDGVVRRLEGDTAQLARTILAFVATPRSTLEVLEYVESLAGPLGDGRAVVEQLIEVLAETGAITRAPGDRSRHDEAAIVPANIVVAVSGAIAATHAPALVAALQRRGHTVEVVLTQSAQRFVAVDALAAIAGREIHTTLWPCTPHAPVPHVALASWADLVIVYPASATTIGRIAHGDFSDLVSAIALTTRAPVVLAPSMNDAMAAAPAVRRNLAQLREDGFVVLHGVPSQEVADAPSVRGTHAGVAPAPGEVAAMVDALRSANALTCPLDRRRAADAGVMPGRAQPGPLPANDASGLPAVPQLDESIAHDDALVRARIPGRAAHTLVRPKISLRASSSRVLTVGRSAARTAPRPATSATEWDALYRAGTRGAPLLPWVSSTCDADIAAALEAHGAHRGRLLDIGCGLGQVARHAAAHGYAVVATDLSETALSVARRTAMHEEAEAARRIVWLVDDICATRLCGPFDVIVDRAVLHTLPTARVHAWAQAMRRLTAPGGTLIVKAHRDGVPGITTGWTADAIADRLPDFDVVVDAPAELPGVRDGVPIPSVLVILRRR